MKKICCRCFDEVDKLFKSGCENPQLLGGLPIGMYHCPDCDAMVIAGEVHPDICKRCKDEKKQLMNISKKRGGKYKVNLIITKIEKGKPSVCDEVEEF